MKYLPRWLVAKFKQNDFRCPTCESSFDKQGVYAAGIKDSYEDPEISVPFIEYCCPQCKEKKLIELPLKSSLIEFAVSIIDDIDAEIEEMNRQDRPVKYHRKGVKKATKKKPNPEKEPEEPEEPNEPTSRSKSKITKEEMNKAMELLDSSESWDEWLKKIGAPMEFAYLDPLDGGKEKKDE